MAALGIALIVCTLVLLFASSSTHGDAANLTCAFGRRPYTCFTGCPMDCNNSSRRCEDCVSGCFCPAPLVQFDSQLCVEQQQCLDGFTEDIQPQDKCSRYETCNDCISADPDCQWCPYQPNEESVKGSRCRHRDLNPLCPEEITDPTPRVTKIKDEEFTDDIQIRPQKLRLELRTGQAEQFTLQFRPSRNFPLDVYFLLDVTGSFSVRFRDTVTQLATDIVGALQNISDRYAVAFGGFGDKRAIPYALPNRNEKTYQRISTSRDTCISNDIPLSDCNPTISFRHTTNFSRLTTDELRSLLGNISIHLNVDALEGGMDGLVQVLTCTDKIGWRNPSLRMLLYMSNAAFHLAGDGKVGGAFQPNPAVCNLEDREEINGQIFNEYTKDHIYDYPSLYQLRQLLEETQTNIVFAISEGSASTSISDNYRVLKEELKLGAMLQLTSLQGDSSNIVSVIQSSYDSISQEIRLTQDGELPQVDFTYTPGENCTMSTDGLMCSSIALDTTVSLDVTVNMTSCLPNTTTVKLRSAAFGSVELELVPLCQCSCLQEQEAGADECSGSGTLSCGVCLCDEGWSGDDCQCEGNTASCGSGLNDEECSGRERGECDCGTCVCHVQEELLRTRNITEPYFGEQCQCDHLMTCGGISDDGVLCSGHGTCDCLSNKCVCTARGEISGRLYTGDRCECDPDFCYNDKYRNRTCVYTDDLASLGDAECGCNVCNCRVNNINAEPAGDGTCEPGSNRCSQREQCARCAKNLQSSDTDCDQLRNEGCFSVLLTNDSAPATHTEVCTFEEGGCTHRFYFSNTVPSILVEDNESCRGDGGLDPLAWIIPVSVIAALLLLGSLALLIVLCIFWTLDRHEFNKFQSNLVGADWVPQENPIYVSPQQEYTNIAYKRSSRRRQ